MAKEKKEPKPKKQEVMIPEKHALTLVDCGDRMIYIDPEMKGKEKIICVYIKRKDDTMPFYESILHFTKDEMEKVMELFL